MSLRGTVYEVGAGVSKFTVGQDVMCAPSAPCDNCKHCKRNLPNLCEFAMDNFVIGAYARIHSHPPSTSSTAMYLKNQSTYHFADAALLEPLSCVTHSYEVLPVNSGETVVIIGTGPIALLHVILAKHHGASKVIAIGRRPYRLEKANELGADLILSALNDNVHKAILQATGGDGADKVYECTGFPEVWQQSLDYVRPGGSIMLFGGCKKGTTVTWDTYKIHYEQITLKGAFHYTPTAVQEAFNLLTTTDLPFSKLITRRVRNFTTRKRPRNHWPATTASN